jgi:aspartyl-tRNA(Asn)/glutamyl-tRNA(Gln) amidotransferase subunit A
MARSALDCALMLTAMAGYDPSDPTSATTTVPDIVGAVGGPISGLRVGIDRSLLDRYPVDPAVPYTFDAAVDELKGSGATIVPVQIPWYEELVIATMSGWPAEAFAVHRRDLATRWSDYGRPTRIAIANGALIPAPDYVQAQRARRAGAEALRRLMTETCDVVVTPTAAQGAPDVEGVTLDEVVASVFTPVWNAVGFPSLSVPMGFTDQGLPLGLQVSGRPYADGLVLNVGDAFQRTTAHHLAVPALAGAKAGSNAP